MQFGYLLVYKKNPEMETSLMCLSGAFNLKDEPQLPAFSLQLDAALSGRVRWLRDVNPSNTSGLLAQQQVTSPLCDMKSPPC